MLDVTDAATAILRALLGDNPALPGRLVKLIADEAGGLGLVLMSAPGTGDVELRPGLVAERGVAERLGGALLDYDAAGRRLVVRRGAGLVVLAAARRRSPNRGRRESARA